MDKKTPAGAPIVERVAGWSARHRIIVVIGWLALVVATFTLGQRLGTTNVNSYDPGQAGQAERVLARPDVQQPDTESVLIRGSSPGQTFRADPQMRQAVSQVVAALRQLPGSATDIQSPFTSDGLTSGRSALVTFNVAGNPDNDDQAVVPALNAVGRVQARHPGLTIGEAGQASVDRATNSLTGQDFRKAEVTSVPVSLVLLLLVFGALVAAGIPLLLAGTAVISAISLLAIPSRWLPVGGITSSIVLLVGMAVGIDYSLFYLRRVRDERTAGRTTREALRIAAATSGRAIVVSGLTVMISLAGLFLTGIDVFSGFAVGTIIVVGVAVLGSLTFLPALLSLLGKGTDRGRIPFLGRRQASSSRWHTPAGSSRWHTPAGSSRWHTPAGSSRWHTPAGSSRWHTPAGARRSRLWQAVVRAVVRRPLALGAVATVALLALAAPVLSLHLEESGLHDLPTTIPVVRTLDAIQQAFPGGPAPAEVVVTGSDLDGPQVSHAVAAMRAEAVTTHGAIREPITAATLGNGTVLLVSVPLAGGGTDTTSDNALATLRTHVLPQTLGKVPGISYAVTGLTAANYDLGNQLADRTPLVLCFILGLAFLLLMAAFRSVAIPAMSILLNLLSVGAAFGLMTLVFQDGHLEGALGFTAYGGITSWLPLFMFVLLFGLSMDYHVFILSRIRELRLRGASAKDAIAEGIASSAGVVTSAAAIMMAVFSIFATLSIIEFKVFGVAMAAAVLIDATVVRGVLLPAGLALLGERAWWPGERSGGDRGRAAGGAGRAAGMVGQRAGSGG